ncbi:MAG: UvrD-helicase domain-containing protein [Oscillospiraceae bacterium]|nr:UvrD-helicase domain-containing protein [Oscillospiraceae bacterium]
MTEANARRFISARRKIIEGDFASLNPEQRRAVLTTEGPLLLLAGAGSGKTTVLIHRVVNLLRYGRGSDTEEIPASCGEEELRLLEQAAAGEIPVTEEIRALCAVEPASPWQVLAITFTNKAADELKSRLEKALGAAGQSVWAMTFHGTCSRILRRYAERLGFPSSFTIYDQADSLAVMKRVLKEMNLDDRTWPPKAMLAAAERAKGALQTPDEFLAQEQASRDIRRIRTAQVCKAYAQRLFDAGAMDFDDLLYFTVRLLKENPDILDYYQNKFRYVQIDEYQDTNHLQYLFASLLAGGRRNICVVGDDDQSIYKFRGATIENILSFEKQYKDARVIRLEQNYRSTGNILRAANAVIANNTARKGKNLWTQKGSGDKITLYVAQNEDDEARFVARTIRQSGRPARDFAILYRTNAQSRNLELTFKNMGINYRIFGGTRFFDRAEVKDVLAYLCVIANPTDETRLLRIINVPARGIGSTSLERVQAIAREEGVSLFEVLSSASHRPGVTAGKKMEEFCRMIGELQQRISEIPLDEFYDEVLDRTGYLAALQTKNADENLSRIENIQELKSSIIKSMENTGGDLYAYLDEVALYTDMDTYDREEDCTVMMTMHSAKGLEFPVVFLVGAEDGLFPSAMSISDQEEMEEERRLCYVAITRAREKLYITCAAQRMLYGRTSANLPSRFTDEIPPELLDRQGVERRRQQERSSYWDDDGAFRSSYGGSGGWSHPGSYGSGAAQKKNVVRTSAAPTRKPSAITPPPAKAPEFRVGDRIVHKAFGHGSVEKLTPMGGDALMEILFDSGETKRLMLRIAMRNMEKESS